MVSASTAPQVHTRKRKSGLSRDPQESEKQLVARKKRTYNARIARAFCALLSDSEKSVSAILREHPEFPSPLTLYKWRDRHPYFATLWKRAREAQAEHLMQKCLDLAAQATAKNAHAVRVKFDIYKFFGQKLLPTVYGDKPSTTHLSTSVAVVISPERLNAIRLKLEASREAFKTLTERKTKEDNFPQSLKDFDKEKLKLLHSNGDEEHSTDNEHPTDNGLSTLEE